MDIIITTCRLTPTALLAGLLLITLASTSSAETLFEGNRVAWHDSSSPQYNPNCYSCHADVLTRETLDPAIPDAHVAMLPFAAGVGETRCVWCHRTTDLLHFALGTQGDPLDAKASLRKYVDVELCALCHGPDGGISGGGGMMGGGMMAIPGTQFYATNLADLNPTGEELYELTCEGCHGSLEDSEVAGASAMQIQMAIMMNRGGMRPLNALETADIQAIAAVLPPDDGGGGPCPPDCDEFPHEPPYDFLFGNHIDTHLVTKLKVDKQTGEPLHLSGDFLIYFTGGIDPASGLPLARHPRGAMHNEVCGVDPIDCVVGWEVSAVPGNAKYISHSGINGMDHPVWLVNRQPGQPKQPGDDFPVSAIPQPGDSIHFHWITQTSTDPRASTVQDECSKKTAGMIQMQGGVNEVCQGWFMKITAVTSFAFLHGGAPIPVTPGIDYRTHMNFITNYELAPVLSNGSLTPTR